MKERLFDVCQILVEQALTTQISRIGFGYILS